MPSLGMMTVRGFWNRADVREDAGEDVSVRQGMFGRMMVRMFWNKGLVERTMVRIFWDKGGAWEDDGMMGGRWSGCTGTTTTMFGVIRMRMFGCLGR